MATPEKADENATLPPQERTLWNLCPLSPEDRKRRQDASKVTGATREVTRERAGEIARQLNERRNQVVRNVGDRLKGEKVRRVIELAFNSMVTSSHMYISGTAGTGKTTLVQLMCDELGIPWVRLDAQSDLADMQVLGGQVYHVGRGFEFQRGVILQPGCICCLIDEIPRLPTAQSNLLLQPAAERKVNLPLYGEGARQIRLSPHWTLVATGNPFFYGGQATKNEALYDRFYIGVDMPHPDLEGRMDMLKNSKLTDQPGDYDDADAAAEGGTERPVNPGDAAKAATPSGGGAETKVQWSFTLSDVRAALRHVKVNDDIRRIILQISYLVSPPSFRQRVSGQLARKLTKKEREAEWKKWFGPDKEALRKQADDIEQRTTQHIAEGSNPRGEEICLFNTVVNALVSGNLAVARAHVEEAVKCGLRFRLKPYPGADEEVASIIEDAISLVMSQP